MKLSNRIMSWLLHPAAYMVWHALGAPEEWGSDHVTTSKVYHIRHRQTGVQFWTANGRWFFDGEGNWQGCIGLIDRHFLWPRAQKVCKKLIADMYCGGFASKKHLLFVKFTQLGGKP